MVDRLKTLNSAMKNSLFARLFLRIAEPRIIRLLQLVTYGCIFWAGFIVSMNQPERFLSVLGDVYSVMYGLLLIVAAGIAGIAVLPGIWWLERVGIILLLTCDLVYIVIIAYTNATPVAFALSVGFGIFLIQRWIGIRGAQLAPREG